MEWHSKQKNEKKTRTPMNKLTYKENCQEKKKKEPYTFYLQARDTRWLLLACVCVISKLSDFPSWWLFFKKLENENSCLICQVRYSSSSPLNSDKGEIWKKIMMSLIGQHYIYVWSNAKSKFFFLTMQPSISWVGWNHHPNDNKSWSFGESST